jgi:hypothetical protein
MILLELKEGCAENIVEEGGEGQHQEWRGFIGGKRLEKWAIF